MATDALLTHATRVAHERIGEVNLEWRHPFFHRPLVEYGMRLPEEWRVAPGADVSKRVLRDAMRGILPEQVRLRRGKGGLQPVIYKALVREANRFTAIAANAVLAELGCLDPRRFAQSIARVNPSQHGDAYFINSALMLELWLRRRSNRWT
jgi:asparagine synthase (glutamine-hydrolysing)